MMLFLSPKPSPLNNSIAIMGCGWLGLPLAKEFIADGYNVHGSTTSTDKVDELLNEGIKPFVVSISEDGITGPIHEFLSDVTILILNIPPKLRGNNSENYVSKMNLVLKALKKSKVTKVIFVSSTSVYGNAQGEVTEETMPQPTTESGIQLLTSERLFRATPNIKTTILRFGGLIGEDRHPINMLSGKKGLKNGNHPVNLIHLNDCVQIISCIIQNNWWNEIFNAVYPLHPSKKEYYHHIATLKDMISPEYAQKSSEPGKIIDSRNLIDVKKYCFKTSILG